MGKNMQKFPRLRWWLFVVKASTIFSIALTTNQSIEVSLNLKTNNFCTGFYVQTASEKLSFPQQKEVKLNFQAETSNVQLDWGLNLGSQRIPAKIYPSCDGHENSFVAMLPANNIQVKNS